MSHSNDDKGGKKPQEPAPESVPSDKRSGRVAFDSRGNPIWEWQLETGVYSRDVTTQKLKKLDLGELSIADSGIHPRPGEPADPQSRQVRPAAVPAKSAVPVKPARPVSSGGFNHQDTSNRDAGDRGGGGNPYDTASRPVRGGFNPYDNARSLGQRVNPDAPSPEKRRTPADLRALDQLIKEQRKKLKE